MLDQTMKSCYADIPQAIDAAAQCFYGHCRLFGDRQVGCTGRTDGNIRIALRHLPRLSIDDDHPGDFVVFRIG